jgi:hypothetical protein
VVKYLLSFHLFIFSLVIFSSFTIYYSLLLTIYCSVYYLLPHFIHRFQQPISFSPCSPFPLWFKRSILLSFAIHYLLFTAIFILCPFYPQPHFIHRFQQPISFSPCSPFPLWFKRSFLLSFAIDYSLSTIHCPFYSLPFLSTAPFEPMLLRIH